MTSIIDTLLENEGKLVPAVTDCLDKVTFGETGCHQVFHPNSHTYCRRKDLKCPLQLKDSYCDAMPQCNFPQYWDEMMARGIIK